MHACKVLDEIMDVVYIDNNVCVLSTDLVCDLVVDKCVGICTVEATPTRLLPSVV